MFRRMCQCPPPLQCVLWVVLYCIARLSCSTVYSRMMLCCPLYSVSPLWFRHSSRLMDLVHYSEGIPSAMHCGYFIIVKMLLCRHYPMLKGLCFSGVSQDLAMPQTGYITRKCSEKTFTAYNQSV